MKAINSIIFILILFVISGFAQQPILQEMPQIDDKIKAEIIESLTSSLNKNYIFPETAAKITQKLKEQLKKGDYREFNDYKSFADKLTSEMRIIANDKHLGVKFKTGSPSLMEEMPPRKRVRVSVNDPNLPPAERMPREIKRDNSNPPLANPEIKAEIISKNIGYLSFNQFGDGKGFLQSVDKALDKLANTNAMIIDLRQNGGGSPLASQYLISYFFDEKPVQLSSIFRRKGNSEVEEKFWTIKGITGKRFLNKPVYILTGNSTFSAAENFAYDMQALRRAKIIGTITGGGANPGNEFSLGYNTYVFIPTGRSYNYITKSNWEGIGVKPDLVTKEDEALDKALQQLKTVN